MRAGDADDWKDEGEGDPQQKAYLRTDPIWPQLQTLIERGLEPALTLVVSGAVVTGTAVRYREYLAHLDATVTDLIDTRDSASAEIQSMVRQALETARADVSAGDMQPPPVIVLRDAELIAGSDALGAIAPLPSMFWRVRMDRISAFAFGRVARSDTSSE